MNQLFVSALEGSLFKAAAFNTSHDNPLLVPKDEVKLSGTKTHQCTIITPLCWVVCNLTCLDTSKCSYEKTHIFTGSNLSGLCPPYFKSCALKSKIYVLYSCSTLHLTRPKRSQ